MRAKRDRKEEKEKVKKVYTFQSLAEVYKSNRGGGFISTGVTVFDLALGSGLMRKKIINPIGDESTCKTGEAVSVGVSFQDMFPNGLVIYDDVEAALDAGWAMHDLGLDGERTELMQPDTDPPSSQWIEQWGDNVMGVCSRAEKENRPILYITDSMDGLPSKREIDEEIDDATRQDVALSRGKAFSSMFRRLKQHLFRTDVTLICISQAKTKIGVFFGEKLTIAGGVALNFYADQRLKMAEIGKIVDKKKNVIGIDVKIKVIKNKAARPFLTAQAPFYFDFGFDNVEANVDFLRANSDLLGSGSGIKFLNNFSCKSIEDLVAYVYEENKRIFQLDDKVKEVWVKAYGNG